MKSYCLLSLAVFGLISCRSGNSGIPALTSIHQLKSHCEAQTQAWLSPKEERPQLFDIYATDNDAAWSRARVAKLDFSGVAWDNVRTCTLISPRHILMAQHYQRPEGAPVIFHDAKGRRIARQILKKQELPGGLDPDICVGLLDEDVPAKFYRVLPPRSDYSSILPGTLACVSNQNRELLVRRIELLSGRRLAFRNAESYPKSHAAPLVVGDSGNPSFLIVSDEPVLLGTMTFGGPGAGPFLSDPSNFQRINEAMLALGGGYQLSSISLR